MRHPIHRINVRPRATFRDATLQQEFAARGYVILPLLSAEHIRILTLLYHSLASGIATGFYNSMMSQNFEYREKTSNGIEAVIYPLITDLLCDYCPLAGSYMVKLPGPGSELAAHQDWNLVDEHQFASINVWAPLTPLTGDNGTLHVIPGSHLFIDGLRPSMFYPTCLDSHRDALRKHYLQPIKVPTGYVVIHNSALVHSSPANQSSAPRVVASLNMIPQETRPIHYFLEQDTGAIDYFEVDAGFYRRHIIGQRPRYVAKDTIPHYQAPALSAQELQRLCKEHNSEHPRSLLKHLLGIR